MLFIFLRIWIILNSRDRIWFFFLLVLMAIGAGLEVLGIGILVPLVAIAQDPEMWLKNPTVATLYHLCGSPGTTIFLLIACAAVLLVFLLKNAYQAVLLWLQNRFLFSRYLRISLQLFQLYLERPYGFHLQQNSAKLLRNVQLVQPSITGVLLPFLFLITDGMTILAVIALLLWADPITSLMAFFSLGGVVTFTFLLIRRRLGNLGAIQTRELGEILLTVQQALGSMKETRILGREAFFHRAFSQHLLPYSEACRSNSFLSGLPRNINESAAVSTVLTLLMIAIATNRNTEAIVTLGLFAVAAIRLLPSLTRIGGALSSIKFYHASLNEIIPDLIESKNLLGFIECDNSFRRHPIKQNLLFNEVSFSYEGSAVPALKKLSLTILPYQTVAFVGPSGAGKTTAADLLLGLYEPTEGQIFVDGEDIRKNLRAWQRNIGYVPQQIYLSDTNIRENVALGVEKNSIDDAAVLRALKMAQLDDLIDTLPDGIATLIGERGTRLSGGQRQRIGIARALYHDPDVLVLDEATAALDNETESAFMESIKTLVGKKTLIMIAHRLTTVEHCDVIFYLKNGSLELKGTFQELLSFSDEFRNFARRGTLSYSGSSLP